MLLYSNNFIFLIFYSFFVWAVCVCVFVGIFHYSAIKYDVKFPSFLPLFILSSFSRLAHSRRRCTLRCIHAESFYAENSPPLPKAVVVNQKKKCERERKRRSRLIARKSLYCLFCFFLLRFLIETLSLLFVAIKWVVHI